MLWNFRQTRQRKRSDIMVHHYVYLICVFRTEYAIHERKRTLLFDETFREYWKKKEVKQSRQA
jgi:hypothetical protein